MKMYDAQGGEIMEVTQVEKNGSNLILRGKVFGTLPLVAVLRPEEARRVFRLLDARTLLFVLTLIFRRSSGTAVRN